MKICPVCGIANPDEFNYCQQCPTQLGSVERGGVDETKTKARTYALVLGAAALGITAMGLWTSLRPQAEPKAELAPSPLLSHTLNTDSPVPSAARNLADPERAARGKALFQRMDRMSSAQNPSVRGQMTPVPTLSLYVKSKSWKALSKSEKVDLSHYVQSMIAVARASPRQYVDIPDSAPLYERFVQVTSDLCDDCWSIMLLSPEGFVDSTAAQGDRPWEDDDPCCRGVRGSELRR